MLYCYDISQAVQCRPGELRVEGSSGGIEYYVEGGNDGGQGEPGGVKQDGEAGKNGDEQDRLLSVVVKSGGYILQHPGGDDCGQMATARGCWGT